MLVNKFTYLSINNDYHECEVGTDPDPQNTFWELGNNNLYVFAYYRFSNRKF